MTDPATPTQDTGDKMVRFEVYIPQEAYENLVRLQELTGKKSLAETIRSALKFYLANEEALLPGAPRRRIEERGGAEDDRYRLDEL